MLKRIEKMDESCASVRIADASYPAPFRSGLEYSAPARGTWNIVHTGMLLPEGHEIFVCAASCLRGVVLTAAEQGTSDRFSTIAVRENNLLDGDMEQLIIDGVGEILSKLPKRPPAVLLYTSCIHHFTGCEMCIRDRARVAIIGIIVENPGSVSRLNEILHEYGEHIIGRMGIPYREKGINIISIAIDAPQDVISSLAGKVGRLDGVQAKTAYSSILSDEASR